MRSAVDDAFQRFRRAVADLSRTVSERKDESDDLFSDPKAQPAIIECVAAAGDLAVNQLDAYVRAAEAHRDAERAALTRAESNARTMRLLTVGIVLAAFIQAGAVVVQIVCPAPAPVVNVAVPPLTAQPKPPALEPHPATPEVPRSPKLDR